MVDLAPLWTAIAGSVVSSAGAGALAYRQGRAAAEDAHDRDVEERLRDCEFELTDIRATLRERKQRQ